MWEFCISINKIKNTLCNYVYDKLQDYTKKYEGIVTRYEKQNDEEILIACNEYEKNRLILHLQDIISECICYFYKKDFLISNLHINIGDEMSKQAFISALLFFDRETDRYIVNKYLNISNKLNLDGFFNFKLKTLKDKWKELIEIANQNEIYLYSNETFMELIKFLVDNIEVKSDVINIMSFNDTYDVFDSKFDKIDSKEITEQNDLKLVSILIALCPKNINIYCSEIMPNNLKNIICKLFEKRVRFISKIN